MDNTDRAAALVVAAGSGAHALVDCVEAIGFDAVVAVVVEELLLRCEPPENRHDVVLQLDLVHATKRASHTLAVRPGVPVAATEGAAEAACIRLEFALTELVRLLYGPPRERSAGTHRTELRFAEPAVRESFNAPLREVWPSIGQAVNTVLGACSGETPSLGTLASRYGSDKWGILHWFTPHYEHHLRALRAEPIRVLEIGIGGYRDPASGGESLRMWRRYFPRAVVFGMDVFAKHGLDGLRLRTVRGDQSDPGTLAEVARRHGPFDVVIDDGSHINGHVITSFQTLFPHLRPGGWYVIEDLWSSYAPGFGGVDGPDHGGADGATPTTSLGLLKTLLDGVHHEERNSGAGLPEPGPLDSEVVGVHVYHNIAFIQRGVNAEGGVPVWIPHSFAELVGEEPTEGAAG